MKKSIPVMLYVCACLVMVTGVTVAVAADLLEAPYCPGQVVIKGGPDMVPDGYQVIKYLPHADLTVVAVESGREMLHVRNLNARNKNAALNRVCRACATVNDPYYAYQWHFPQIQCEQAWDLSIGSGIRVAVLDSGLADDGDDGIGCVVSGIDIVNGDNNPYDGDGHGTHVSGTIAQDTNNNYGVAGLAFGACVMPVKVLDDYGYGNFADVADGMYYAVDHGADVINMSLSTNARLGITSDPLMDPALDYAYAHDVTVVCATGNDANRKNAGYPAIYPTTIGVGAVDYAGVVTRYTNKGTGLDVVAPGGDMAKDLNGDGYGDGVLQETNYGGWGFSFFQGTSMASPHVAAAAAMLLSYGTASGPDGVLAALGNTALPVSNGGYGLIQVYDALNYGDCVDNDGDTWTTCDGDCDDSDPDVYPGADEICGDGIDNNCNGETDEGCGECTDADGDGWCVEDGDCDDDDPLVNPGMPDKGKYGRDGKDNDCNGIVDG